MDNNFFAKQVSKMRTYGAEFDPGSKFDSGQEGTYIQVSPDSFGSRTQPNIGLFVENLNIGYYSGLDHSFNYFGREEIKAVYPIKELDGILRAICVRYINSDKEELQEIYSPITTKMVGKDFTNRVPEVLSTLLQTGFLTHLKRTWRFDVFEVSLKDGDGVAISVVNTSLAKEVIQVTLNSERPEDIFDFRMLDASLTPAVVLGIFVRLTKHYRDFLLTSGLIAKEPQQWEWVTDFTGVRAINSLWLAWQIFGGDPSHIEAHWSGTTAFKKAAVTIAGNLAEESNLPSNIYRVRFLDMYALSFQIIEIKETVVY